MTIVLSHRLSSGGLGNLGLAGQTELKLSSHFKLGRGALASKPKQGEPKGAQRLPGRRPQQLGDDRVPQEMAA
jgi:hypothetical protein